MRRFVILALLLVARLASAQLATPTVSIPSGTYYNMVYVYVTNSIAGVNICATIDGTDPSAAVAGTCDNNGSIYQSAFYGAAEVDGAGVHTYKAMATKVGAVNSAIVTATYTITDLPAIATLTNTTPVKITSSAPGTNYFMPQVITAPNGRILVWYGYGVGAFDHGHSNGIEMKYSDDNGATWNDYAPTKVTKLTLTNIGSGYTTASCAMAAGGGTTATCTAGAPVDGAIPSIALTSPGAGYDVTQIPFYTHPILCNVIGGGGTGATCQAWQTDTGTHAIAGVRMSSYGSGYTSTPGCSITQVGNTGTATCTFGAPVNGAITSLTLTNRGTAYTTPPAVTISGDGTGATASANLNACEPGDPANCFWHDLAYGNAAVMGGGVTYSGTVVFTSFDSELGWNSTRGPRVFRSLDNGANWEPSFNVTLAATQTHSPANMISIPPGSPGVSGSCAAGCLIQWTTEGGFGNTNFTMKSYDDGVTWTDLLGTTTAFPNSDEETAIAWPGGMNLIAYTRVGRASSSNLGWPEPIMVRTSSNLGTTWSQYISNLPTGPCTVNPDSYFWIDQFTRLVGFVNPQNPTQFTFMYGERFNCPIGSDNRWRTVTFDMAATYAGFGKNTPMPQMLNLAPGVAYGSGHTTYSGAWPTADNNVLMAWEQAVSLTAEDIYVSIFSYPPSSLTILSTSPLPDGIDNTAYNYALTAIGGTAPYTWAVTAGDLAPCGLALSAGGVVSGATPIAGTCTFTAELTDAIPNNVTKPFSVTINHFVPPTYSIKLSGGVSLK